MKREASSCSNDHLRLAPYRCEVPYAVFFRTRSEPWLSHKPPPSAPVAEDRKEVIEALISKHTSSTGSEFAALLLSKDKSFLTTEPLRELLRPDIEQDEGVAKIVAAFTDAAILAGKVHPPLLTERLGGRDCAMIKHMKTSDRKTVLQLLGLLEPDTALSDGSGRRRSALWWALTCGDAAAVQFLCERGADPFPDAAEELANRKCAPWAVRAFMQHVQVKFVDGIGQDATLLHVAACHPGCLEILRRRIGEDDVFRRKMHARTRADSLSIVQFAQRRWRTQEEDGEEERAFRELLRRDVLTFVAWYEPRLLSTLSE